MFPGDMLVPARMQQQPRGHPSTGDRCQGKPICQKKDVANPEGRDLSPGARRLSRGLGFFGCWAPLLRVALWPQLTVLDDVLDDVLAPRFDGMVEDGLARGVSHHQVSSSPVQLLELRDCQIARDELPFPAPSPEPWHRIPGVPGRLCGYSGPGGELYPAQPCCQVPSLRVPQERNKAACQEPAWFPATAPGGRPSTGAAPGQSERGWQGFP